MCYLSVSPQSHSFAQFFFSPPSTTGKQINTWFDQLLFLTFCFCCNSDLTTCTLASWRMIELFWSDRFLLVLRWLYSPAASRQFPHVWETMFFFAWAKSMFSIPSKKSISWIISNVLLARIWILSRLVFISSSWLHIVTKPEVRISFSYPTFSQISCWLSF